tara:strand:+ start:306 stop:584 length:279 start_codon:yes stop_codon:yes gene_type:complete
MNLRKMIEFIQQHHPHVGETEIIEYLNEGLDEFSEDTRIVEGSYTFNTVIDQRYYTLPDDILEIKEVSYDSGASKGKRIPRLIGIPEERDIG